MPLFQYFGWVGSFLLAALFAASWWFSGNVADAPPSTAPLSESIHIRIHSDHKWPERVVFDTTRSRLAPAENAQAETEPQGQQVSQELVASERHDPVEAFAEMGRRRLFAAAPISRPEPGIGRSAEAQGRPPRSHAGARSRHVNSEPGET
jgi:hypothetical protein